jgi:hypothetical protein
VDICDPRAGAAAARQIRGHAQIKVIQYSLMYIAACSGFHSLTLFFSGRTPETFIKEGHAHALGSQMSPAKVKLTGLTQNSQVDPEV